MCGMIILFLSPNSGLIVNIFKSLGWTMPNLLAKPDSFAGVYVWSDVWQHIGWDSIIYLAALSAIDPTYYEAATMDGASRIQKILNIDLPLLLPTAMILLILRAGSLLSIGFEKVLLLQNPLNLAGSEVISTYVYKVGMLNFQYSYSTAIGLFNTVVNLIILLSVNWFSKRYTKNGTILKEGGHTVKWFKVSRKSKSDLFFDVVIYGFAILLILLIVYPLWFVVIASFSNPADVANGKVWFIPSRMEIRWIPSFN